MMNLLLAKVVFTDPKWWATLERAGCFDGGVGTLQAGLQEVVRPREEGERHVARRHTSLFL